MAFARRSLLGGLLGAAAAPAAPALLGRLHKAMEALPLTSTHEHILSEAERLAQPQDFFGLAGHYLVNDLISAGLDPKRVRDWDAFEPVWRVCRFTGYAEAFRIAMRDLYGAAEISRRALPGLQQAIAARHKPGLYRWVLKERMNLRYGVLDDYWNGEPKRPDPEFFVLARKFDWFVYPASPADVKRMEEVTGVAIHSLKDYKRAMEKRVEQSLEAGMVTIKTTLAYQRPLRFAVVGEAEAETLFERWRGGTGRPPLALSDHVFHHLMTVAEARRLPVQVHTGLQAGNGNTLSNSQPEPFSPVIARYPKVTFDLFHIGYPYTGEVTALAKMFPNVTADFCWAHIISPAAARRALDEMLDAVPYSKIMGFGGDYRYPELSYAHARMARANIAAVLSERVAAGWCREEDALEIARALLDENPRRVFPQAATVR